jgi:hypothetical protein
MILYHGSFIAIEKPDLSRSRDNTDFGKGFYTTPLKEQAEKWTERFSKKYGKGVVSAYEFLRPIDKFPDEIKLLEFNTHSKKWLDFVTQSRLGKNNDNDYDLIIGGVADDKVFETLTLYFDGLIYANEAIRRLRYNKPNFQYCFKNQAIIDKYLIFKEAFEVKW